MLEAVITTEVCAMTSHYGAGSTAARAAVSNLLTSAKFHKGLLACCLEVVITCCKWVVVCRGRGGRTLAHTCIHTHAARAQIH